MQVGGWVMASGWSWWLLLLLLCGCYCPRVDDMMVVLE